MKNSDHFIGCLLGQALGDALGFPVEGYNTFECTKYVNDYLKKGKAGHIVATPFPFGQYTDDTQLARELMISLVECHGFVPENFAERIVTLFSSGQVIGHGKSTLMAVENLMNGITWEKSGASVGNASNGSAMRAAPMGLFYHNDPEELVTMAVRQSFITHQDSRCAAGSVAIAMGVALLISEQFELGTFLDRLTETVQPLYPYKYNLGQGFQFLKNIWLDLSFEEALQAIQQYGNNQANEWVGISPFVTSSVLWSFYSFLKSPDNYWEAICTAIKCGGDVDTTAAMTGALSGAYLGQNQLPLDLLEQLTDQEHWGIDELSELAIKLYSSLPKELSTATL